MLNIAALPYIPQRPPFILIDRILDCDEDCTETDFVIPYDHVLVHNGQLSAAGILENIAQTCAARIGWLNRDKPVCLGVVGGISRFEIFKYPHAGEHLHTCIKVLALFDNAMMVKASVRIDRQCIAEGEMKVFLMKPLDETKQNQ